MKLPSPPAIIAVIGITVLLLAGVIGITATTLLDKDTKGPDVKALVTEAILLDCPELEPTNGRVIWRRTNDPNEIVVAGVFAAFAKNEHYFTTLVMKYNTGWVVGHINNNTTETYRFLTREEKKKKLAKK